MPVGFSKACRTCLTLDGTLISIYDSISHDGRGRVTDIIKDITQIKPMKSDGLPELVCQTCLNEINRCYSFKIKCLNSDSTLRKLFAIEEELETTPLLQQQVVNDDREYKPILQNLIGICGPDDADLEYEPPVKIKTEKDQDDQSFGYFVITSVCSQNDQTTHEETSKAFQPPQIYIKQEIDYEIDSYNTSSTRRYSDLYASDQSQCFDNISMDFACPQVKLEVEEPFELEDDPIEKLIRKPTFKCPKCSKEFLYTSSLKKHLRSHNSKPYTCSTCSKCFKLSVQLRNHIDIAHRNIKPFKCEECPRTFSFPSKLKEHLRSHKGSSYYKNNFSISGTSIEKRENEEPSQIVEYSDEKKPEAKCSTTNSNLDESINEQTFIWTNERSTRRSARIHREEMKSPESGQTETQPNSSTSDTSVFKIKTRLSEKLTPIDYSFDGQDANLDDKSSLEGSRQYNCPHCTKVFKYLSRLNEHIVCHSDARPFDCVNCGKFFKTPGQLTRHIKTSHKVSSLRGRRKPFAKRHALKRKNINKNFLRSTIQSAIKNVGSSDEHGIENENEDEDDQSNVSNAILHDENILGPEDDSTNAAEKDQPEITNEDKHILEPGDNLPETEAVSTKNSKFKKLESPSKRSKPLALETASGDLTSPDVDQESKAEEEISTEVPRTYHCDKCDETFVISARFYKHMRGHGIERPFICSLCGKGFKNCGNLKSHIVITHKKLKPFKCNDCKRAFSCKSNLNKHLTSRMWTHSCTKEFNSRRGGSKKKIKNKKQLTIKIKNNELTSKQKIPSTKEGKEDENKNNDEGNQEQKSSTEKMDSKLDSSEVNVETPSVSVDEDATHFAKSGSVAENLDLSKSEPTQLNESHLESEPKQVEEKSVTKKPKNRLECPQCKKVFVYFSYLKKHMQSHSNERNFICTICDKAFKYKVSLKSHNMVTHAKIKPYKCDKCPQAFVNEYTYRVHRNSHNKANKKKHKAKLRRALAKSHILESTTGASVDQSISNPEVGEHANGWTSCSVCALSIESEKLMEHMREHHNTTESSSASVVNPDYHSNKADNEDSGLTHTFECAVCKKVFLFASYLKKHMRCHNDERPHVCSNCGKAFKDFWRLRSHIKEKHASHSKKTNHKQKRKKIKREKHLMAIDDHLDVQFQNDSLDETNDMWNIPQDLMNLSLNEEGSLDNSNQMQIESKATNSNEVEVDVVKPRCTQCDRVFQFASQLETHMRTHTGERPFVCLTCNKTFTQNGHLKNHVLIHHKKIMPFQCSVCLRGFASGFNMRAHEKTHFNQHRKKVKSSVNKSNLLQQADDENLSTEATTEPLQNAQDDLQDQVILDFEKLELHPLFGSMSANQDENTSSRTEQNSFFPCPNCKKTFVFLSDLDEHIKTHSANARPYNCSICYKTFRQEAHLKNHTQMSHTKTRNYKCNECDRVFLTFYILNKHMRSHKGKKNRSKVKSKNLHKRRGKYQPKIEKFEPDISIETGNDDTNEQQPKTDLNEENAGTFSISKGQNQNGARTATAKNNIEIACALCSVLVDSDDLTDHMKQCLSASEPSSIKLKTEPLEEPQCKDVPIVKKTSRQEQEIDTGISKHCTECEKEFCSFALFADHMKTHNVDKPFVCKTCDKGFKKNAHLKSHIMIVHKRILPYKCIECSRSFSSKYNLQMHMKTHTAKVNLKKGNSKRGAVVKNNYYKDPSYNVQPRHDKSENRTSSPESQHNESKEDKLNNSNQNQDQVDQSEEQFCYGGNENKVRCTLCFVSVHPENLSKHLQEFHNLPESLTCMAIKKEPSEEPEQLEIRPLETDTSQTETPRKLQCPTCDKEFIHLSRLNEHMRAHSDERPFICLVCGKTFKRHGHLTTHISMCHKKTKPFKCKECQETFSSELDFDVHSQTHTNQQHSSSNLLVEANLQNEINLEPSQSDELLPPCNIGAEFLGECTTDETHQCTLCPTVFKSISHLMEHMKVHTSDQPFICSLCGKGFRSNDDLVTHRLTRHSKSNPYSCEQCKRKFRTSLGLRKHLLVHSGAWQIVNRKHKSQGAPNCRICKKSFTNNWVLKEHMKCHTAEKPFACPICRHSFSKKYNLKIHIMAHKKIKPFKCLYCPQSYCTNSGRTHHMRKHGRNRNEDISIDSVNTENTTL